MEMWWPLYLRDKNFMSQSVVHRGREQRIAKLEILRYARLVTVRDV